MISVEIVLKIGGMNRFKILVAIFIFYIFSCKNEKIYEETYYSTGELKSKTRYINGKLTDTFYFYYKNGKLKEKGILDIELKKGWWYYYNKTEKLKNRSQYIKFGDSIYKNQSVNYNDDGNINKNTSSYFTIKLSDTIPLGKSLGDLYYNTNFNDIEKRELFVIIDNEYNNVIKKDTFIDVKSNYTFFGIYSDKLGEKIIKGEIIEQLFKYDTVNPKKLSLKILEHRKYFEKEVYVKDTID